MLAAPQIRSIDKASVHNICSGQVIVTLATAAKELVENSIDAGAKYILITFREHGLNSIEVADDGRGIEKENYASLTMKHHTSKIKDFEDISDISTFGFRGEALSSLCALGNMTVLTSTGDVGTCITYDRNGGILKTSSQARPRGTTVTIHDLFHTLPVRHKEFCKNIKKEFHKAIDGLQAYAMITLNVRIHCINIVKKRKQVIFSTQGKSTLRDNVINVLGSVILKNLVPIEFKESVFQVGGYISKPLPKHGRGSADKQYIFINGRPCDHEKLVKTINSTFRNFDKFQYPVFVIVIEISKECLDVNVTPDKRRLFLDHEDILIEALSKFLDSIFQKYAGVYADHSNKVQLTLPTIETQLPAAISPASSSVHRIEPLVNRVNLEKPMTGSIKSRISEITHHQAVLVHHISHDLDSEVQDLNGDHGDFHREIIEANPVPSLEPSNDNIIMDIIEPLTDNIARSQISERPDLDLESAAESEPMRTAVPDVDKPICKERREVPFKMNLGFIREKCKSMKRVVHEASTENVHFKHQIDASDAAEKELNQTISKAMFRKMRIIGQFNLGFILVRLASNLFIIDQHATDEKFRFEKLKKETKLESQKLMRPKLLSLNGAQEELLMSYEHIFTKNGFEVSFQEDGEPGRRICLTSLPRSRSLVFDESDVEELLWLLSEESSINVESLRPSKVHRMFASRACRSAIMIGTALDLGEMRKVVDHMAEMEHPWNCPHGRPTMRHVVDLARIS